VAQHWLGHADEEPVSKKRLTISVVLIVKDEQDVLADCLDSVRWADEIVVYDTGSTDETVEIARRYTDKVVEGYWDEDFAAARNRALEHATSDWVLSMDADEVFESQGSTLRKRLAQGQCSQYGIRVVNVGKSQVDSTEEFTAPRVFTRADHCWKGRLHEQPARADGKHEPAGAVLSGIRLRHTGYADRERLSTQKAERNISLARTQVQAAQTADDRPVLAGALVNLARSLTMDPGDDMWVESNAVGEQAWELADQLPLGSVKALVECQVAVAMRIGEPDQALVWVERWRSRQPDNPEVDILATRVASRTNDVDGGLEALARVPAVAPDGLGGTVRRDSIIDIELTLLTKAGRADEAVAAVRRALVAGQTCPTPMVVLALLGDEAFTSLLVDLSDNWWRRWAMLAVKHADAVAMRVLELMDEFRPGDANVLVAGARVAPLNGLHAASQWDAKLHRHQLGHLSTLITYAADERGVPDDRAVAAALAFSAYHDERALPHLTEALSLVPQQRERAVAEAIEVVAPGLVSLD